MEIHLNETAHRVIGIAPLERRSKSHGNARGVYEPGNKDIRRCHCADKRIVRNLLCPLNAERRKPRANKIHVYEHVGLNCEERQDIKFSVIDRAEFFVIFELVTAQPVYDNQKPNTPRIIRKIPNALFFASLLSLYIIPPCLSRNDVAKTRDLLSNTPRLFFRLLKHRPRR